MQKYIFNILIPFLLSICLFSCFEDGRTLPGDGPISPFNYQTSANGLRIVNLAPNSPTVNFVLSTSPLLSKSKFKSASAAYDIGTSARTLDIIDFYTKKGYKSFKVTKEAGKTLFFVLYDKFESYSSAVFSNTPRTISKEKFALRFFLGTSAISSKVNIKVQNSVSTYSITDVEVGKVTDWIDVESGYNNISVFPSLSNYVSVTSKAGLEGGKVYTAFIGGYANAPDSQKLSIYFITETDTRSQELFSFKEGTSNYRFVQNSIGGTYDLMVDLSVKFSGLPFKRGSVIDQMKAGTRNIKLTTNNGSNVKFDGNFSFSFDKYYLIVAVGVPAKPEVLVIENAYQTPISQVAMLRLIHASANSPGLKFALVSGATKAYQTLSYKGTSSYMALGSGGIDVAITNNATKDTLIKGTLYLEGGKYYTGFVIPKTNTSSDFTVELIEDTNENSQDLFGQL